jgi:hypothetical protein
LLVVACGSLAFIALDNTVFWDDEAHTAFIARNWVQSGRPIGWDERNLYAYRNGACLDEQLRSRNPPLDIAVCAASFALLGESTWTARFPFVVAGVLALVVCVLLLREEFPEHPAVWHYSLAVFGLSPVFLLNIRQCRYNALAILFSLLAYYGYRRFLRRHRWRDVLLLSCSSIALFYANFLIAAGFLLALAVVHGVRLLRNRQRGELAMLTAAAALFLVATVPYAVAFEIWSRPDMPTGADGWNWQRLKLLWWNFRDVNVITSLPWTMFCVLLYFLLRRPERLPGSARVWELLLFAFSQVAFVALLSPQPTDGSYPADVRYLVATAPFLAILVGIVLAAVHRARPVMAAALLVILVSCNLLTLHPGHQRFRLLLPGYLYEVSHDYPTAYGSAVEFIRQHVPRDSQVLAVPEHTNYPLMYYCGDPVRFCCLLDKKTPLPQKFLETLEPSLFREQHFPEWIIAFGLRSNTEQILRYFSRRHRFRGETRQYAYRLVDQLDCFCFDTSRPELMWHTFGPQKKFNRETERIFVFRRSGNIGRRVGL